MNKARKIILIVCAVVFLGGLVLFLYPDYLKYKFKKETGERLEKFDAICSEVSEENTADDGDGYSSKGKYDKLYRDMKAYNEKLYKSGQNLLVDEYSYEKPSFLLSEHGVNNDEVLAFIEIPAVDISLPVFNGASYDNMLKGAVCLANTSLPIGGDNTNCVIAAHNQWKGVYMFMKIPELKKGDSIYVRNFWGTLEYKVYDLKVIAPDDISEIMIKGGRRLLTLTTCYYTSKGKQRYMILAELDDKSENNSSKNSFR